MDIVESEIEGVKVRISDFNNLGLKKSRIPGIIATFKDRFSGETLKITTEMIKSNVSVKNRPMPFNEIRDNKILAERWNEAFREGLDFVQHNEKLAFRTGTITPEKTSPSISTTLAVKTLHGADFSFPIEYSHGVERIERLSPVKALQRFGFNLSNKKTLMILAKHARENGFENAQSYTNYLKQLALEHEKVNKVIESLLKTMDQNNPSNALPETEGFITSIRESLSELGIDFRKECEEKLTRLLNGIANDSLITGVVEEVVEETAE